MNHIVNGRALLRLLVRGAEVEDVFGGLHLRAGLRGADSLKLGDQEVEFEDELAEMLVLPDNEVDVGRGSDDLLDVGSLVS